MATHYSQRFFSLDSEATVLESLGTAKNFPANTVILSPGDPFDYCIYIKSGIVIGYDINYNGSERYFNYLMENSILFDCCMFSDEPSVFYFKTTTESELVFIKKEVLYAAMKENFAITEIVLKSLSHKFISVIKELRLASIHSAAWRICDLLQIFAGKYGMEYDGKILIKHKLSYQMLGNLLGLNRITTVRTIKRLKELNLIEQINGFYCIRDINGLNNFQLEQAC